MRRTWLPAMVALLVSPGTLLGQVEQAPPDVLVETIRAAYSRRPTADEVTVRVRSAGTQTTESFIVRIDPGTGFETPARVLLELGSLRVHIAGRELTAVHTSVPGLYYRATLAGPPTPATLAAVMPPIPAPQLAMACSAPGSAAALTTYTPRVDWSAGVIDSSGRVSTATLRGHSEGAPVVLTASMPAGRITGFATTTPGHPAEMTIELTMRPVDPGEPTAWAIGTEGRERVESMTQLRPAPASNRPLSPGDAVPDIVFQQRDFSLWNLWKGVGQSPRPLALVMFRSGPAERAEGASADARAGWSVLRAVGLGQTAPGEPPAKPIDLSMVGALVMELGQFSAQQWDAEQQRWGAAPGREQAGPPGGTGEPLLWSNSAAHSIDRFDPRAGAVIALVSPERKLIRTVVLDGRAGEPVALAAELRAALAPAPPPPAPAEPEHPSPVSPP
ncbi:MAG: hypothetical protein WD749_14055 [Phycisphaerales bacterium]